MFITSMYNCIYCTPKIIINSSYFVIFGDPQSLLTMQSSHGGGDGGELNVKYLMFGNWYSSTSGHS